ncbi:hypothetical protein ASE04_18430 [Rhizobium sp. Root708]|uniref:ATP-binding domain-containing protein n=1 Tax=Rhizobium sp. Root708 TaxID=1736592 RepID=UPI0006FC9DF0|nr:ATP-binding domain-containing protein [Rhizobium sp. Root708]KRB49159.1 hypothetical protein ASE04_18430 [Rhizobium sp. Root708]
MSTWWKDDTDLIDEQMAILDIAADESILIQGPPGSGKTNLLLLRANYLALGASPNLQVVVFGSLLKSFIQIGGAQYKFPVERITTHARLFNDILRENGKGFDANGMDLEQARQLRADGVQALINSGKVAKLFDALLLDEAQDYTPQEIKIFAALTKVLVAAADEHQQVFEVDSCFAELEAATTIKHGLNYHFRNGRDICSIADAILAGYPSHVPLRPNAQYDELAYPVKVTSKSDLSIAEQAQAIADQIADQLVAYPGEKIGVLCPKNEDVLLIADHLAGLGYASQLTICKSDEFDPQAPIWLSSMSAAKGLEFRCVHIAGLDNLSRMGGVQKRLAYTAVTRAKTALSFYYDKKIPAYLDGAISVVIPRSKIVTKARIFGKE